MGIELRFLGCPARSFVTTPNELHPLLIFLNTKLYDEADILKTSDYTHITHISLYQRQTNRRFRHTTGTKLINGLVQSGVCGLGQWYFLIRVKVKWTFGLNPRQSYENKSWVFLQLTDRGFVWLTGGTVQKDVDRGFLGQQPCPAGSWRVLSVTWSALRTCTMPCLSQSSRSYLGEAMLLWKCQAVYVYFRRICSLHFTLHPSVPECGRYHTGSVISLCYLWAMVRLKLA